MIEKALDPTYDVDFYRASIKYLIKNKEGVKDEVQKIK